MGERPVAINVSELGDPDWNWLGGRFEPDPFRWLSFSGRPSHWLESKLGSRRMCRYRACLQAIAAARRERAQVIVTHEPEVAVSTAALYQASQLEIPHLAFAFTFSELPTGARRRVFKRALRSVDRFVCFSTIERARYAEYFDIPAEKIDMLRWSVAEPEFDPAEPPLERGPYLCAVGSQGRDYATLVEAMRQLPHLGLVLVALPENLTQVDIPPNVRVRQSIPLSDVWNIVAHAKLMVLPLRDTQVPCGHGTQIMAMQLRTPSIVTESKAMTDYVEPEKTGLVCAPADPDGMAEAIDRLWQDEALAAAIVENGRIFATEECSEQRTAAYFADYLRNHGLP